MSGAKNLPTNSELILVVDAGGSTLRLGVFDESGNRLKYERIVKPHETYECLEDGIDDFLSVHTQQRPVLCVVGAAGPIKGAGESVRLTNNPKWPIFSVESAKKQLGIEFVIVNDLIAAAACIPIFAENDLDVIRKANPDDSSRALMVTLSTGVNSALVVKRRDGNFEYISGESGHVAFAARNEIETELAKWAWRNGHDVVSVEDVISGSRGFEMVYEFVRSELGIAADPQTLAAVEQERFKAPVISNAALSGNDEAAQKTLKIMGPIIGTYLSSLVVTSVGTSGVYLMGGISENQPLMNYFLNETELLDRFLDSGKMQHLTEQTPIYRVLMPELGMRGGLEIARGVL